MDQNDTGMQVGLGPGHIVLDWDPASPSKGEHPQFSAHVCCGQMAEWIKMPLGRKVETLRRTLTYLLRVTNVTDGKTDGSRTDRQTDRITMATPHFALECIAR